MTAYSSTTIKRQWVIPDFAFLLSGLLLALGLRICLLGFESADYRMFLSRWYDFIRAHGGFRALRYGFSDYTPAYLYLLTLATYLPMPKLAAIKSILILFDFFGAGMVYLLVHQKYPKSLAPGLAGLALLFTPTVFVNSALWAQCDITYTALILASLVLLFRKRMASAYMVYGVALSFKLQAAILLPLYLILALKRRVSLRHLAWVPAAYLILFLPCWFLGRPWQEIVPVADWVQGYANHAIPLRLTLSAPNLYQWIPLDSTVVAANAKLLINGGFVFALSAVFLLRYLIYKSEAELNEAFIIKCSLVLSLLVPFVLPEMHERYFFMADVVSIIYAFYFPRFFYFPLLLVGVSFISYTPFLFGRSVFDLSYLAVILAGVLILSMRDLILDLYPEISAQKI